MTNCGTVSICSMELVIMLLNLCFFRCIREVNNQRRKEKLIRILYHTDAAQGIGKIKVDVDELKVDYLTVVGHKVILAMF